MPSKVLPMVSVRIWVPDKKATPRMTARPVRAKRSLRAHRPLFVRRNVEQALHAHRHGWQTYLGATHAILALGLAEHGDLEVAEKVLRVVEGGAFAESAEQAFLLEARGRLRWLQGRPGDALDDYLAAGWLLEERVRLRNARRFPLAKRRGVGVGPPGRSRSGSYALGRGPRPGAGGGSPRSYWETMRVTGEIEEDPSRAVELFEQSVIVLAGSHARLEESAALVALGAALRRAGDVEAAGARLRHGLELASMGIRPRRTAQRRRRPDARAGVRVRLGPLPALSSRC
jgi:hypothetical protein